MSNKKETPFQIKIPKEKQKQMAKDLEKVEDLKSAIHFVKNYKKYIIVNRNFKKKVVKFSIKSVASLTAIVIGISLIKHQINDKSKEVDITPVETTTESTVEEPNIGPILSDAALVQMNYTENTIPTPSLDLEEIGEEISSVYDVTPSTTISFPRASDTNEKSDYDNYYKVKDKFGPYVDSLSKEFGIDSRLIIAIIAQENPDDKDETYLGTYGPTCVTTAFRGETITYGHYVDDAWKKETTTIDYEKLKPSNNGIYKNGEFGNITNAEAYGIRCTCELLQNNYNHIVNNNGDKFTYPEYVILDLYSYNFGYPGANGIIKYCNNFSDATYSLEYENYIPYEVDKKYGKHVLNKIPDEELVDPIYFTDCNGSITYFNLDRNNDLDNIISNEIINKKSI